MAEKRCACNSTVRGSRDAEGGFERLIRHSVLALRGRFPHSAAITHGSDYWLPAQHGFVASGFRPPLTRQTHPFNLQKRQSN